MTDNNLLKKNKLHYTLRYTLYIFMLHDYISSPKLKKKQMLMLCERQYVEESFK